MQPEVLGASEDSGAELRLDERLAAADRNPALGAAQELRIAADLLNNVTRGGRRPVMHVPRVGVVAVQAAQRTTGEEQHIADVGTIRRAAALHRMHPPLDRRVIFTRFGGHRC